MGDQGQGQGSGLAGLAGLALPLAALGATIYRPQTLPAFSALAQQGQYMDYNRRREAEAAREQAGQTALAQQLSPLYPGATFDPNLSTTAQMGLATLFDTRARTQAAVEKDRLERARQQRGDTATGQVLALQGQIGSELPDTLRATRTSLAPDAALTEGGRTALKETDARLDESAKRLATANAAARPFQYQEQAEITPPPPSEESMNLRRALEATGQGDEDFSLGVSPLSVPPLTMTQTPDNVHALQRHLMQTGEAPTEKNAEALATQFNVPMRMLPGGAEARRASVKPPFAPATTPLTDAQGRVTIAATKVEPETGELVTQHTQLPGTPGQPQQPQQPNDTMIRNSLAAVVTGQGDVLPMHRGHTPRSATQALELLRRTAGATPDQAANIIGLQMQHIQARIKQLSLIADDDQRPPQQRVQAQGEIENEQAVLHELNRELTAIKQSGMRGIETQPQGPPSPLTSPSPLPQTQQFLRR